MMSDNPYLKLREYLDRFPLGFPQTPSGIEMEILRRLFTEEEATLAVALLPLPEEVRRIAKRTGLDQGELEEKLDAMSKKGLIFRVRREGKVCYNAAPFMIGLYEYSVKKMDKELAALFKEYYETAYQKEMGASNVPGFKVIPIGKRIPVNTTLFPLYALEPQIKTAKKISVADCICRKEADLTGVGCGHPMETCLSFGAAAEYYIENGIGREITAEEAITIVEESDRAGLVHAGTNTKHLSNICNCCPCCCASMKGITEKGENKRKYMNALFEAIVDDEECVACEDCVDRCPVAALTIEDVATVDREKCLGCGLCVGACSSDAITMHLREDREEPFDRVLDMGMAILKGKRENA